MLTGEVTRATGYDKHGDQIDPEKIGTVTGLIFGWNNSGVTDKRGNVASTQGQIGVPTDAAITLRHDDTLVIEGVAYKVHGGPQWGRPHSLTGSTSTARYRWYEIAALVN
ncbi:MULTISPECIES: hypothetical protein [unclassified Mycolicibacterium]|uniref:hypothetical protein n=1 Tax=unclassified Mycolicibacterium TaxID=2636767 RepID=UPI0012DD3988|nr:MULTISPECIES: hypothetical protein [unclassified Mycolicibacterium]MUL85222.1 hypothetical protein [Mycolicibacterium sp. CBMA 329]MUL91189.1 hypothetical protein [Mycolicibacterium sp. CBMA 331]MUL98142.1 hypothetical protein [Mycolicibacterium sp. CBMA 334]MUM25758.1 hypothetical protein [Mycolicibacterium sp. CBMA 295]MUM40948.1 hypothetical protein [Mycolicibacterium sp. CBMA 247]